MESAFQGHLFSGIKRNQTPSEGLFDSPRAGGHDLLESSHDKPYGPLLLSGFILPETCGIVSFFEVIGQFIVKSLFPNRKLEFLCRDLPPHEDWVSLGIRYLSFGSPEHHPT